MTFRPLLRAGLRARTDDDGGRRLLDPPTGLELRVDAAEVGLLDLLDGRLGVDEAVRASGVEPDAARRLLASLGLCGLLVGTDEAGREARLLARASGAAAVDAAPFRLPLASRFECGRCGACCRGAWLGTLSRAELDRLSGAAFVRDDPALAGATLFVPVELEGGDDGEPRAGWTLARGEGGACVFLRDDGRCKVEVALGPAAKPLGCRLFPWRVLPTADGVVVADRTECATFSVSSAAGAPLHEAFDAARPLLREAARRAAPAPGGPVRLPDGTWATGPQARWALHRAVEALDVAPSWPAGAAAAAAAARQLGDHAGRTPLGPRFAEQALEQLFAAPRPAAVAPGDAPRAALARLAAAVRTADPGRPGAAGPVVDADLRGRVVDALERLAAGRAAGLAPAGPAVDGLLRRALRQRLFGLPLEADGDLAAAVGRALLTAATSEVAARAAAAARGAARAEPTDLDRAQADVVRLLEAPPVVAALRAEAPALRALFDAPAALRP